MQKRKLKVLPFYKYLNTLRYVATSNCRAFVQTEGAGILTLRLRFFICYISIQKRLNKMAYVALKLKRLARDERIWKTGSVNPHILNLIVRCE